MFVHWAPIALTPIWQSSCFTRKCWRCHQSSQLVKVDNYYFRKPFTQRSWKQLISEIIRFYYLRKIWTSYIQTKKTPKVTVWDWSFGIQLTWDLGSFEIFINKRWMPVCMQILNYKINTRRSLTFILALTMWQQNTNKTWGCLDLLDVDHHLCVSDSRPHGHT